jgi:RNA polymerase sigma-70 factor (ECF subfamily)
MRAAARIKWQDRAHFLAASAQLMRRILVDYARSRQSHKRVDGTRPVPLDTALDLHQLPSRELVKLDDALSELAEIYSRSQLYSPAIPGSGASTPRAVASAIR